MAQTGASNTFAIPFDKVRGGDLTVSVTVRGGALNFSTKTEKLKVVGTNPSVAKLASTVAAIDGFRKLMRVESRLRQFLNPGCPLFSGDGFGGVGLCQLTSPAPTDDQVWSWKENAAGGLRLYKEKQSIARSYPASVRKGTAFAALAKAYNDKRIASKTTVAPAAPGQPAAPAAPLEIELPGYADEQLERDTLRGFNGYAGGLHEYRVNVDKDGLLVVTEDAGGTKGKADWEQITAADRIAHYDSIQLAENRRGDPNYVDDVERQASF
jgi:hypothetical protein